MDLKPANLKRYASVTRLLLKYRRTSDGKSLVAGAGLTEPEILPEDAEKGEALAKDLESLGPTFIKLGQVLSSRSTLIPPAYAEALERLQDSVEPFPYEEVERIVTDELGVRISKAFETFDRKPLASASLGQVHRARLRDGRQVVVKVQRPNIRQRITEDLEAFDQMARLLEKHTSVQENLDLPAILDEFRKTLFEELDYRREAQNLDRLAEELADFELIVVPRPVHDYTTSRVLTMDYIEGEKITKINPVALLGSKGEVLAEELFRAYLKQILVDGFFHADPHPGNVFLTPDGRIALIDLGMVYRLSPQLQDTLLMMVLAIADGRGEEAADHTLALAEQREGVSEAEFRRQVASLVAQYSGAGLSDLSVGKVFLEIVDTAVRNGVALPPETTLLGKTLFNLDAVGRTLAPGFNPTESIRSYSAHLLRQRMLKSVTPGNLFSMVLELRDFLGRLPARVNRILDAAASNQLGIKIDTGIDGPQFMVGFQKVANRITMGLILAALIVGAAMLMQVETTFRIFGYPGLAILLFLAAAGGGIVLLFRIVTNDWKDERKR